MDINAVSDQLLLTLVSGGATLAAHRVMKNDRVRAAIEHCRYLILDAYAKHVPPELIEPYCEGLDVRIDSLELYQKWSVRFRALCNLDALSSSLQQTHRPDFSHELMWLAEIATAAIAHQRPHDVLNLSAGRFSL